MKTLLLILFFIPLKGFSQKSISGIYYSSYGMTNWFYYFFEDNSFKFTSNGHLGIEDTIHGIYRIYSDTIVISIEKESKYKQGWNNLRFKIKGDSCIVELGQRPEITLEFCRQRHQEPGLLWYNEKTNTYDADKPKKNFR